LLNVKSPNVEVASVGHYFVNQKMSSASHVGALHYSTVQWSAFRN